uniref:Uncharacterized protein n=1 Tax=Romanomermis culicivorax TaxID=13658 RepID=A0A915L1N3_ROMCU
MLVIHAHAVMQSRQNDLTSNMRAISYVEKDDLQSVLTFSPKNIIVGLFPFEEKAIKNQFGVL